MNSPVLTLSVFVVALGAAAAQVASHTPTIVTPAPAQSAENSAARVVARVNGAVLTDADLTREEYSIFPYAKQHGGLPKEMAAQIRDGAMKMIIFEELVYQEALHRKMTVSPVRMHQAEAAFRQQFASPEEFRTLLERDFHGSQQLLEEKIRRSLLIEALLKTEIEDRSGISIAEARTYYEKNPARFEQPESYTFQSISILPPAKASAEQIKEGRARADRALKLAKATKTSEEFGLLAEKMSDDDYRVMMGQHKPLPVDQLTPEVAKALAGMKPGQVSDVIQIGQAYTIIHFQVHAPASKAKFEEVKAQIEKELHQSKQNQLRAALDKKLRQNAKIEEL